MALKLYININLETKQAFPVLPSSDKISIIYGILSKYFSLLLYIFLSKSISPFSSRFLHRQRILKFIDKMAFPSQAPPLQLLMHLKLNRCFLQFTMHFYWIDQSEHSLYWYALEDLDEVDSFWVFLDCEQLLFFSCLKRNRLEINSLEVYYKIGQLHLKSLQSEIIMRVNPFLEGHKNTQANQSNTSATVLERAIGNAIINYSNQTPLDKLPSSGIKNEESDLALRKTKSVEINIPSPSSPQTTDSPFEADSNLNQSGRAIDSPNFPKQENIPQNHKKMNSITFQFSENQRLQFKIIEDQLFNASRSIDFSKTTLDFHSQILKQYIQGEKQTVTINQNFRNWRTKYCDQILAHLPDLIKDALHPQTIQRLKFNLNFYLEQAERNQFMTKIMEQNKQAKTKIEAIKSTSREIKSDYFLAYYFLEKVGWQRDHVKQAILKDQVDLIEIYKKLCENSRISQKKLLNREEEIQIQAQLIKIYEPSQENMPLGKAIIEYFEQILLKNSSKPSNNQLEIIYIKLLNLLDGKLAKTNLDILKTLLNNLILELHIDSGANISKSLTNRFKIFTNCFVNNRKILPEQFRDLMNETSQIQEYRGKMKDLLLQRMTNFIKQNDELKLLSEKQTTLRSLYCVFFLEQTHKIGLSQSSQFLQKLFKILFFLSPMLFLERLSAFQLPHFLEQKSIPLLLEYSQLHLATSNHIKLQEKNLNQVSHKLPATVPIKNSIPQILLNFLLQSISHNLGLKQNFPNSNQLSKNFMLFNKKMQTLQGKVNKNIEMRKSKFNFNDSQQNISLWLLINYCNKFGRQSLVREQTKQIKDIIFKILDNLIIYYISSISSAARVTHILTNQEDSTIQKIEKFSSQLNHLFSAIYTIRQDSSSSGSNILELNIKLLSFYTQCLIVLNSELSEPSNQCLAISESVNEFLRRVDHLIFTQTQFTKLFLNMLVTQLSQISKENYKSLKIDRNIQKLKKEANTVYGISDFQNTVSHHLLMQMLVHYLKIRQMILQPNQENKFNKNFIKIFSDEKVEWVNQYHFELWILLFYKIKAASMQNAIIQTWPIDLLVLTGKLILKNQKVSHKFIFSDSLPKESSLFYGTISDYFSEDLETGLLELFQSFGKYIQKLGKNSSSKATTSLFRLIYFLVQQDRILLSYIFIPSSIQIIISLLAKHLKSSHQKCSTQETIQAMSICSEILANEKSQNQKQIAKQILKGYLQQFSSQKNIRKIGKIKEQQFCIFVESVYFLSPYLYTQIQLNQSYIRTLFDNIISFLNQYTFTKSESLFEYQQTRRVSSFNDREKKSVISQILKILAFYIFKIVKIEIKEPEQKGHQDTEFQRDGSFIHILDKSQDDQISRSQDLGQLLVMSEWLCESILLSEQNRKTFLDEELFLNSKTALVIIAKVTQILYCYYYEMNKLFHFQFSQPILKISAKLSQQLQELSHKGTFFPEEFKQLASKAECFLSKFLLHFKNDESKNLILNTSLQYSFRHQSGSSLNDLLNAIISSVNKLNNLQAESEHSLLKKSVEVYKLYSAVYNSVKFMDYRQFTTFHETQSFRETLEQFLALRIRPLKKIAYLSLIHHQNQSKNYTRDHQNWSLLIINTVLLKSPKLFQEKPQILTHYIRNLCSSLQSDFHTKIIIEISAFFVLQFVKFVKEITTLHLDIYLSSQLIQHLYDCLMIQIDTYIRLKANTKSSQCPSSCKKYSQIYFEKQSSHKFFKKSIWEYFQDSVHLKIVNELLTLFLLKDQLLSDSKSITNKMQFIIGTLEKFQKIYIPHLQGKILVSLVNFREDLKNDFKILVENSLLCGLIAEEFEIDDKSVKSQVNDCTEYLLTLGTEFGNIKKQNIKNKNRSRGIQSLVSSFRF